MCAPSHVGSEWHIEEEELHGWIKPCLAWKRVECTPSSQLQAKQMRNRKTFLYVCKTHTTHKCSNVITQVCWWCREWWLSMTTRPGGGHWHSPLMSAEQPCPQRQQDQGADSRGEERASTSYSFNDGIVEEVQRRQDPHYCRTHTHTLHMHTHAHTHIPVYTTRIMHARTHARTHGEKSSKPLCCFNPFRPRRTIQIF